MRVTYAIYVLVLRGDSYIQRLIDRQAYKNTDDRKIDGHTEGWTDNEIRTSYLALISAP